MIFASAVRILDLVPVVSVFLFLLLQLCSAGETKASTPKAISIPSFTLDELNLGSRSTDLLQALRTTGLFSVQLVGEEKEGKRGGGHPNLHRSMAMNGICDCSESLTAAALASRNNKKDHGVLVLEGVDSVLLDDQTTRRTTIATATVGTSPLPLASRDVLEEACGEGTVAAMEVLRDQVALASDAFVQSLDRLHMKYYHHSDNNSNNYLLQDNQGGSYATLQSVVQSANHLEHFHHYIKDVSRDQEAEQDDGALSMDWHTDAGLFLAFVPAWDCHSSGAELDTSFWVQLPEENGQPQQQVQAKFDPNSVVIMMGAGAEHWLRNSFGLRATRHAVRMSNGDARTWYGMMHLVPDNAIIQEFPARQTFGEMKTNMRLLVERQQLYGDINPSDSRGVAIGCGPSYAEDDDAFSSNPLAGLGRSSLATSEIYEAPMRRRLQHVQDASACNNATNFFCWMQCLEIPNYKQSESYVNEGYSLYCLDPGVLARTGNQISKAVEPCGLVHNSNCMGVWHPTAPGLPGQAVEYNSTAIYDDDGVYCYGGTSMYMDGFHWVHDTTCVIYLFPQWVLSTQGKFVAACFGTLVFGVFVEFVISKRRDSTGKMKAGYYRLAASAGFYGLQLSMGYLIMLVVMTYSLPLFLCCVFGLVGGNVLFNAKDAILKKNTNASGNKSSSNTAVGSRSDTQSAEAANGTDEEIMRIGETPEDIITTLPECCCNNNVSEPMMLPQDEYSPIEEEDDDIPEGSTPCCQNVL